MLSRPQKPTPRDFLLMHAQTRTHLCTDKEIFDPCEQLSQLTPFEKATLTSWSIDSNVDRGLNLYILLHYLSAINNNSSYYHYVNNGTPDGTNMFGHIIGTSGSGKSSALTPHMDALGRTLTQMDINQEHIQYPSKDNDLSFEQPFIISNATALHIYRSLIYGNRLLCSTECDTLLSNLGAYGNQFNDPRFAENVNMLIQMFDEGRRASIIGASVGDPYARVSQQHYEGTGISGVHNRFTHYPCPVMKAIKINSGSTGAVSNMVPSLQHVYTVSILLGKIEYMARRNVYDKSETTQISIFNSDVEEKWKRLRPMANRQYYHSFSQTEVELEELEVDATREQSKSAFYYMFNRVYNQWEEATLTEKQEHEAIISFKNSTKIPRFICNFARFRSIMNILWDDAVYPFTEISEVVKPPYRVSDSFVQAVKSVIDHLFPPSLRKNDGTKILIIEKDTAMMGDLFFAQVDNVSRRLFDLSSVQEKINCLSATSSLLKKDDNMQENVVDCNSVYADASVIVLSKFIFFSASAFNRHRQFHNSKDRLSMAVKYLIDNELIYHDSDGVRFIKGAHSSYAMATPNQIKNNKLSIEALAKLNLDINDYEQLWQQCLLPTPELSAKIDKYAINYINLYLSDYISIINRLGNVNDPVAQEILKPGLHSGQIGIDFDSNTFSLAPEHILQFNDDDDIMKQLSKLCIRATDQKICLLVNNTSSMIDNNCLVAKMDRATKTPNPFVDDYNQLQTKRLSYIMPIDISSNEYDQTNKLQQHVLSTEDEVYCGAANPTFITSKIDNNSINECAFVLEKIKAIVENGSINTTNIQNDLTSIQQWSYNNQDNHNLSAAVNDLAQTASNGTLSYEKPATIETNNNKTTDSFSSIEYDRPTAASLSINDVDHSSGDQQQSSQELFSKLSSSMNIEYNNDKGHKKFDSDSMEFDYDSNFQTSSPCETISLEGDNTPGISKETFNEENILSAKTYDFMALSKKLMLKSFITFTATDVTRLYNSAETKNAVINYLKLHKFIKQINDLFLSTSPTKRTFKPEVGYLKLFPASRSASDTAAFEIKLREKVGITFDNYVGKVFNGGNSSVSASITNNIFNTTRHNWLLNLHWYDRLKEGHFSVYYQNKIICPDTNISPPVVTVVSVSSDNVHDLFDRPRSKLTASQRTNKELRRLGAKRQKESSDQPTPKRQRKPKRFIDED